MFRQNVLPWLAWWFFWAWTRSWRIRTYEPPELIKAKERGERLIFAHWHGDELCILPLVTSYRIATMTSTSRDGELIDFLIRRLGGATSRGSSTRGGITALKGLIRLLQQGFRASVAVDGPKGPLHVPKPGVFELARLGVARIVPVGAVASKSIVFEKSWNKARLPRPFAKVYVHFLEPWEVATKSMDPKSPELVHRLTEDIAKACKLAAENLR